VSHLGKYLRKLREDVPVKACMNGKTIRLKSGGISQAEAASHIGISQGQLSKLESGYKIRTYKSTLIKLANFYNIEVNALFKKIRLDMKDNQKEGN
jgi:transcriptional regulator with XRE-family HTH domain